MIDAKNNHKWAAQGKIRSHHLQLNVQGWIWLKTWLDWGGLKVSFYFYHLAILSIYIIYLSNHLAISLSLNQSIIYQPIDLFFWVDPILSLALVLWWQNGASTVSAIYVTSLLITEEKKHFCKIVKIPELRLNSLAYNIFPSLNNTLK